MTPAHQLVRLLRDPGPAPSDIDWSALLTAARAERLLGTLAHRLETVPVPASVGAILEDARLEAVQERRRALWEAEMARRALAPLGVPAVLLKGTAFAAAGLDASTGRSIGDLDILVPDAALNSVEAALRVAGWEPVKTSVYDDRYYRRWMHELPPLIHRDRDGMIDVHHTILPPTARPKPDAADLLAQAIPSRSGFCVLAPADMVVHASAHLFADGDLSGGLRNLWDIDRLLREFSASDRQFWDQLRDRAVRHQLSAATRRAVRLSSKVYGTPVPVAWLSKSIVDPLYERRLLVRDGWGRQRRPLTRFGFFVRSHAIRMPPLLLSRHLWVKLWRADPERSSSDRSTTPFPDRIR